MDKNLKNFQKNGNFFEKGTSIYSKTQQLWQEDAHEEQNNNLVMPDTGSADDCILCLSGREWDCRDR